MRILFLTQDFLPLPGGIAVFLHNLGLQLSHLGHQVDVLTPKLAGMERHDSHQPYRVFEYSGSRRPSAVFPTIELLRLHSVERYEVVLMGHFMSTHAIGLVALQKILGVPYAILCHGNDLHYAVITRCDAFVASLLLRNTGLVLANSSFTRTEVRRAGFSGHIEVLHPGVDTSWFRPTAPVREVLRRHGLVGRRAILTTARLVRKKNLDRMLRALPQVLQKFPSVVYVIAGEGQDRMRLQALAAELEVSGSVRFLGHVPNSELPALYCSSELLVMPSAETFGISFLEASACGKPVIGTKAGGAADAVVDRQTGLLVDPDSTDEIAGAIIRLLEDCPLARHMGQCGRQRVERDFAWQTVGGRLDVYLRALAGSRR